MDGFVKRKSHQEETNPPDGFKRKKADVQIDLYSDSNLFYQEQGLYILRIVSTWGPPYLEVNGEVNRYMSRRQMRPNVKENQIIVGK